MNFLGRIKQSLSPKTRSAVNSSTPVSRPRCLRVEQLESRQLLSVAPPVIFDLDGRLYEGYYGQHTVETFRDTGAELSWDHTHTRNSGWTGLASTSGTASIGSFNGEWVDSFDWVSTFLGAPGIGLSTTLSIYVRGGPGTPYYLDVTRQGTIVASDSGHTSGSQGNTVTVIWDGTEIAASRQTISQPINARDYAPSGITSGPTYQFPEYPGVVFSRVYYRGHQAHIWSNQGAGEGSRAHGEVNVHVVAQAYIRQGSAPVPQFSGPAQVNIGTLVVLGSLSYDPDNGSTTPGSGILSHEWEITGPDGNTIATGKEPNIAFVAASPGSYYLRLKVIDDEGMLGFAAKNLVVTTPKLAVAPAAVDFGAVEWGDRSERRITIRNVGGRDSILVVASLSIDSAAGQFSIVGGEGSFSLRGGQSRAVIVRFAPQHPYWGAAEGKLVVESNAPDTPRAEVALRGVARGAVPENFSPELFASIDHPDWLAFENIFESSSGQISDLSGIKWREVLRPDRVLDLTRFPPFTLPFPWGTEATPELLYGDFDVVWQADAALFRDGHGPQPQWDHPAFSFSPQAASFTIHQTYQYSVPWVANGEWQDMASYDIVRDVRQRNEVVDGVSYAVWDEWVTKLGHSKKVAERLRYPDVSPVLFALEFMRVGDSDGSLWTGPMLDRRMDNGPSMSTTNLGAERPLSLYSIRPLKEQDDSTERRNEQKSPSPSLLAKSVYRADDVDDESQIYEWKEPTEAKKPSGHSVRLNVRAYPFRTIKR